MTRLVRLAALATLAGLLCAAAPADSPINVPEPDGLYDGPQHGYTPPTLKGAKVVDLTALERLMAEEQPVLIDVGLADRKPDNLPAGTIWLPSHRSIPGSVWMPNAGAVPLSPAQEDVFLKRAVDLTGGDKARAVVTFCHPECWGSWNAGKRLVEAGYTGVHWFALGVEGWQDAHETVVTKPDPAWAAVTPQTARPPGAAER